MKRQTRNGELLLIKNYLIPASNTQEVDSYQVNFFHFWQNANFSPTFAVCRKRDGLSGGWFTVIKRTISLKFFVFANLELVGYEVYFPENIKKC